MRGKRNPYRLGLLGIALASRQFGCTARDLEEVAGVTRPTAFLALNYLAELGEDPDFPHCQVTRLDGPAKNSGKRFFVIQPADD